MNSSKLKKKKKKVSNWIITDIEDQNVKISQNKGFSISKTKSFIQAIPGGYIPNHSEANVMNSRNLTRQEKRKLKIKGTLGLKKCKLQSFQDSEANVEIIEAEEKNNEDGECINGFTHADEALNEEKDRKDSEVERTDREYEIINGASEITEEENNSQTDTKEKNNISVHDDVVNMMNKLLTSDSDSDSAVSSVASEDDTDLPEINLDSNENDYRHCYNEELFGSHSMYMVEDSHQFIIRIPYGEKIHFEGKIKIKLLYGGIRVFGYQLDSSMSMEDTVTIYCPRRCMQFSIYANGAVMTEQPSSVIKKIQSEFKITELGLVRMSEDLQCLDTLILIEKVMDKSCLILNHYCDSDLFLDKEVVLYGTYEERKLGCFINDLNVLQKKGFTRGFFWSKIKPMMRTIICGGKGVGKSTLFKYLINCKLMRTDAVLCIDLDPGQTEFTAPGCVCAVIRKKPLLGPNFTNITPPVKMAFIGHVNVALDPVRYMKAVNYIVESCREDPALSELPWFVNTMGFNKGIGMDIMVNIIKLVQPDKIVQINSSDKSRNYEIRLSPELVQSHPVLSLVPIKNNTLKYVLYNLKSCSKTKGIGFQGGYRPAELREFMMISYFGQAVSYPYCSLNAVQPRWIHFSKIYIAVSGVVQPNYILKAINGNLVGLCDINGVECTTKSIATTESNDCFLKIAIQPEVAPCFGIGLVRGIDVEEGKIYIITPISNEELDKVNCLYLGRMSVPPPFYLKQKYVNASTVYTECTRAGNIRSIKNQFRYFSQAPKQVRK